MSNSINTIDILTPQEQLDLVFNKDHTKYFRDNKHEITTELLETLRDYGNPGKLKCHEILDTPIDNEKYHLDAFGNRISFNGNRMLKKSHVKMALSQIHLDEIEKCSNDIYYFMDNYIKITTKAGVSFPELRQYQRDFIDVIIPDENEAVVSLQPRQSGKSVTVGIYLCHTLLFKKDMNIGIAANRANMAREFLDKVKKMFIELPIWMQVGLESWNKSYIEAENGMRILTDATSGDSFRGYSVHIVIVDETAFIKASTWEEFSESIFPAQSGLAFKKVIQISTANGQNFFYRTIQGSRTDCITQDEIQVDSLFELNGLCIDELYESFREDRPQHIDTKYFPRMLKNKSQIIEISKDEDTYIITYKCKTTGMNGFIGYEVDWRNVPRFRPDGSIKTPEEFQNEIIKKHGEVYWNSNYAGDFIGSSFTLLSSDAIKKLQYKEPINKITPGLLVYENPIKSHQYIMTIDASKDGIDAFSVQVIDITGFKFKQVAAAKLDVDYLIMPEIIDEWVRMYNNAFLIIENNEGAGQSVADQMFLTYEYDNLYFDKSITDRKKKKYPGFRTTTKSRKLILQTMKTFIENGNLELNDKNTINEFFTFILEKGKYQADDGCHDDMIMSLALVFAPFCNSKNFEDMKAVVDVIFRDHEDSEDINVSDVLVIGGFDDGVQENEEYIAKYESMEEYYGNLSGFN